MSDWPRLAVRLAPLGLVAILAAALIVPKPSEVELASRDEVRAAELRTLLDALPESGLVLIAFDPDLGTYAEIRPTVRALLGDLGDRTVSLAVTSLTPEGRALWHAERARLERRGLESDRISDLGFRPGAEAAIVELSREPVAEGADLVLVVGGNDLGPRIWIEQLRTRLPDLQLAAVAPTLSYPELRPYLATGQLGALLGTVQDGAAYRASVASLDPEREPGALAFMAGMLVAIAVLGQALLARFGGRRRRRGSSG